MRKELLRVTYKEGDPVEGWAEFMRLWLTQPAQAQRLTPRTSAYLEDLMRENPQLGKALRTARKGMTEWLAQDPLTRAVSKIGDGGPVNAAFDSRWAEFRQNAVDDLAGLERFEREVTHDRKGELDASGPYKTARLMRAKHDIAQGAVEFGAPIWTKDGNVEYRGPALLPVLKDMAQRGELEDFLLYMVGRRARQLKGRGKENHFSQDEITAMLGLRKDGFDEAAEAYQQWNQGLLKFAVQSGVVSAAGAAKMAKYFYVPFFREGNHPGQRKGKISGDVRATGRIKGGTGNLRDVLGNILENADRLIDLSLTNDARRRVAELASDRPGGGHFMAKIPKDNAKVRLLAQDAKESFSEESWAAAVQRKKDELAKPSSGLDDAEQYQALRDWAEDARLDHEMWVDEVWEGIGPTFEVWQRGLAPKGDNIIAVLHDGKPHYFEVADPLLLRSLEAFNRPGRDNFVVKAFGALKDLHQYTITRTPDFMGANLVRDNIAAGVVGKYGYVPFLDAARGAASVMRQDDYYKLARANGVGMGHIQTADQTRSQMEMVMRRNGLRPQNVLNSPRKLKYALDYAGDLFEMATRSAPSGRQCRRGCRSARRRSRARRSAPTSRCAATRRAWASSSRRCLSSRRRSQAWTDQPDRSPRT